MDRPDISVVIPTYNRKDYLQQAISSCFEGNEGVDVEVVVVDDGSTDGTRAFLEELDHDRVRPFLQEHQGGQVARNRGLREARGTYVKFLDDDDWLAADALTREVEVLTQEGCDVCYGAYQAVDDQGRTNRILSREASEDFVADVLRGPITPHPLHLSYRRTFVENLEWDPEIIGRQDLQFLVDVAVRDPDATHVDRIVGYRRLHDEQTQSERAARQTDLTRVHAKILLRAVRRLEREDRLTSERRYAAAEALWPWAHMLSAYDWPMFQKIYAVIRRIRGEFLPDRTNRVLALIDRVATPEWTETILHIPRRLQYKL